MSASEATTVIAIVASLIIVGKISECLGGRKDVHKPAEPYVAPASQIAAPEVYGGSDILLRVLGIAEKDVDPEVLRDGLGLAPREVVLVMEAATSGPLPQNRASIYYIAITMDAIRAVQVMGWCDNKIDDFYCMFSSRAQAFAEFYDKNDEHIHNYAPHHLSYFQVAGTSYYRVIYVVGSREPVRVRYKNAKIDVSRNIEYIHPPPRQVTKKAKRKRARE